MGQLHLYLPKDVEERLRERAQARGIPLSRYLAEIVGRDVADDWPEGFFHDVVGGWRGEPLRRPRQGRAEEREDL